MKFQLGGGGRLGKYGDTKTKKKKIIQTNLEKKSPWQVLNCLIFNYTTEKHMKCSMVPAPKKKKVLVKNPQNIFSWCSKVVPCSFYKYFIHLIGLY